MKSFYKIVILSLLSFLVFVCQKDPSSIIPQADKDAYSVYFSLVHGSDNTPVSGVEITLTSGETATTDSLGGAKIMLPGSGSYGYNLFKRGYLRQFGFFGVEQIRSESVNPILVFVSDVMFRTGVTVTGTVFHQVGSVFIPSPNAYVELSFSGNSYRSQFEANLLTQVCDAKGNFTFENLPERLDMQASVLRYTNDSIEYLSTAKAYIERLPLGDTAHVNFKVTKNSWEGQVIVRENISGPSISATIYVHDAITNNPVPQCSVYCYNELKISDSTGSVVFWQMPTGTFNVRIIKGGYANVLHTILIPEKLREENISENYYFPFSLLTQSATITGILRGNIGGRGFLLNNALVDVLLPDSFANRQRRVTTNEVGRFLISDLPIQTSFTINANQFCIDSTCLTQIAEFGGKTGQFGDTTKMDLELFNLNERINDSIQKLNNGIDYAVSVVSNTGAAISNARVFLNDLSLETNSIGLAIFKSTNIGSYRLKIQKEGYAEYSKIVDVGKAVKFDANNFKFSELVEIKISGLCGAIKGKILCENKNLYPLLPKGITVTAKLPSIIPGSLRLSVADSLGNFRFDSLPEGAICTLSIKTYSSNTINWNSLTDRKFPASVSLCGDSAIYSTLIVKATATDSFSLVSDNMNNLLPQDSLWFKFVRPIDTTIGVRVSIIENGYNLAVKYSFSDGGRLLSLRPITGLWQSDKYYTIEFFNLTSILGERFSFLSDTFSTNVEPENVNALSSLVYNFYKSEYIAEPLDYNTSNVRLIWQPSNGATLYDVYKKLSGATNWIVVAQNIMTAKYDISLSDELSNGRFVTIVVVAKNHAGKSSNIETALPLILKDTRGPRINPNAFSGNQIYGANNLGSLISRIVSSQPIFCENSWIASVEPLASTARPIFSIKESSYIDSGWVEEEDVAAHLDTNGIFVSATHKMVFKYTYFGDKLYSLPPENVSWKWKGNMSGWITMSIPPNKNASYDTLIVDFRNMRDLAGNLADTSGEYGVQKYILK